jgi:hypothetical protein
VDKSCLRVAWLRGIFLCRRGAGDAQLVRQLFEVSQMIPKHIKPKGESQQNTDISFRSLLIVSLVVICIQALGGMLIYRGLDDWSARSSFGEMFGAFDALFSGLAFAGVIYTILLQRRELELQRREIEMTRQELEESLQSQQQSQRMLAAQTEALELTAQLNALNIVPAINCGVYLQNGETFLTLINAGNTSAFDVDVLSIMLYDQESTDIPTFLSQYVRKDCPYSKRLFETEGPFYGVYDHFVYAIFPQRKKVTARFHSPLIPKSIYMLLQFRDARGNNYHYLYWFYRDWESDNMEDALYRLGSLQPKTPCVIARIDFKSDSLDLLTADGTPIPDHVAEFVHSWDSSIPSGYTIPGYLGVEDRGRWLDI